MDSSTAKADHRAPPPLPFLNAPDGICRLCGNFAEAGRMGRLRRWHTACLDLWTVASDPRCARIFVYRRDRGRCGCGTQDDRLNGAWQVDHDLRLRDADPADISFWLPDNLRTRCLPCHSRKTRLEQAFSKGPCHE
jgi:hypothetical protein